jgi:hypothetical protein
VNADTGLSRRLVKLNPRNGHHHGWLTVLFSWLTLSLRRRHPASAERLSPRVPSAGIRLPAAIPFASIRLGLGLAVGAASRASAHPLEYVPCPAHNENIKGDGKNRRALCLGVLFNTGNERENV